MPTARSPEQELAPAPEPAPAPEQERPRRYGEWASPYREGQMPAAGMPSTPQRSPAPSGMDHSARRRRRGGGGGGGSSITSPSGGGSARTTPPRARTTPLKVHSSPGVPPELPGQGDSASPAGAAGVGGALRTHSPLHRRDPNRPTSPVRGDIPPEESQIAAHEFRGLWAVSEKKRQKAEAECFQRRRENEQLKERLSGLEQRLRGTLESSGGAKSQLRGTQAQLQELEEEMQQLKAERSQLERSNAEHAVARDQQARRLHAAEEKAEHERQRAGEAEAALADARAEKKTVVDQGRRAAAEAAAQAAEATSDAQEEAEVRNVNSPERQTWARISLTNVRSTGAASASGCGVRPRGRGRGGTRRARAHDGAAAGAGVGGGGAVLLGPGRRAAAPGTPPTEVLELVCRGSELQFCVQAGLERELHSARERLAEAGSAASGAHREAEV